VNQSKKAIKGPQKGLQKANNHVSKAPNPRVMIISLIVLVILFTGIISFEQFRKKVILTINEKKYDMEDMMYYFYITEAEHSYYDQLFQSMGGGSYWDMPYDEASGTTVREYAKTQLIDSATWNEVLYQEAIKANYSLTSEEVTTIGTQVNSILTEMLSKKAVKKTGLTDKYLNEYVGKQTLATRYHQDIVDSFDIDDAAIKATFDFADYRQYDIQRLFISTQELDDEGNSVELSADKKTAAYDKISAIYEEASKSADWSTLLPEDEEGLTYKEDNFIETDTTYPDEFEAMIMGMSNNSVSEIYEAEDGYYIVKMIDNKSTESYDNAVETAITAEETKAFDEFYDEVLTNYDVKVNYNNLDPITMGEVTIVK